MSPFINSYHCSDEWFFCAVMDYAGKFPLLCRMIGQPELAEDRVEETDFLQKAKKGENSFEHCKHWTKTTLHGRRGA
jgi:crotonobetainyl-CoA:carnitine CoA-transferase CaiB-like acyl-CoA transferase